MTEFKYCVKKEYDWINRPFRYFLTYYPPDKLKQPLVIQARSISPIIKTRKFKIKVFRFVRLHNVHTSLYCGYLNHHTLSFHLWTRHRAGTSPLQASLVNKFISTSVIQLGRLLCTIYITTIFFFEKGDFLLNCNKICCHMIRCPTNNERQCCSSQLPVI